MRLLHPIITRTLTYATGPRRTEAEILADVFARHPHEWQPYLIALRDGGHDPVHGVVLIIDALSWSETLTDKIPALVPEANPVQVLQDYDEAFPWCRRAVGTFDSAITQHIRWSGPLEIRGALWWAHRYLVETGSSHLMG